MEIAATQSLDNTETSKMDALNLVQNVENKIMKTKQITYNKVSSKPDTLPDILDCIDANEKGDAELFTALHKDKFCFDYSTGRWYRWKDHFWEEDRVKESLYSIKNIVDLYEKEAARQHWEYMNAVKNNNIAVAETTEEIYEKITKRIWNLQTVARSRNILFLSTIGSNSLGITGNEWDKNPWLLGCTNGVIDLKEGVFREGRSEDYLKTAAPVQWNGFEERAPTWIKFLLQIFDGDISLVKYFQRLLGYSLTGLCQENIFPILWGKGRNAKSTLIEVMNHILGKHAGPIQVSMLLRQGTTRSSSAPSPDIMTLRGKRLVWASESDKGKHLDIGKIKWLSGDDTLIGRPPFGKREVSFNPTFTMFLITNHKPSIPPDDFAMWQRVQIIPFTISFVEEPKEKNERRRDPKMKEKLLKESSGILAWLFRGCLEKKKNGLNPPEIIKVTTEEYKKEEDAVELFINECCVMKKDASVTGGQLFTRYKNWCDKFGFENIGVVNFGKRMKKKFKCRSGSRVIYYELKILDNES